VNMWIGLAKDLLETYAYN